MDPVILQGTNHLETDLLKWKVAAHDKDVRVQRSSELIEFRERVPLIEPGGGETAWTYVYNRVPDASTRIPHADWRRWLAERDE